MNGSFDETRTFRIVPEDKVSIRDVLLEVSHALKEKGYNPVNQLVGYLMSGDPTYVTSHKGALQVHLQQIWRLSWTRRSKYHIR
jgi:uncharacterized protein (UPF0297 family)